MRVGVSGSSRRLHAERGERIRHRIGDHAADGDDAALARALGAERIDRRGVLFQHDGADVGKVGRGRHQIIGERAGQQLPCSS